MILSIHFSITFHFFSNNSCKSFLDTRNTLLQMWLLMHSFLYIINQHRLNCKKISKKWDVFPFINLVTRLPVNQLRLPHSLRSLAITERVRWIRPLLFKYSFYCHPHDIKYHSHLKTRERGMRFFGILLILPGLLLISFRW